MLSLSLLYPLLLFLSSVHLLPYSFLSIAIVNSHSHMRITPRQRTAACQLSYHPFDPRTILIYRKFIELHAPFAAPSPLYTHAARRSEVISLFLSRGESRPHSRFLCATPSLARSLVCLSLRHSFLSRESRGTGAGESEDPEGAEEDGRAVEHA